MLLLIVAGRCASRSLRLRLDPLQLRDRTRNLRRLGGDYLGSLLACPVVLLGLLRAIRLARRLDLLVGRVVLVGLARTALGTLRNGRRGGRLGRGLALGDGCSGVACGLLGRGERLPVRVDNLVRTSGSQARASARVRKRWGGDQLLRGRKA